MGTIPRPRPHLRRCSVWGCIEQATTHSEDGWAVCAQHAPRIFATRSESGQREQPPARKATRHAQRGQGLVEYSLIIAFVVLVAIGGLLLVGPMVGSLLSGVTPAL